MADALLDRRTVLEMGVTVAAGTVLAGCAPQIISSTDALEATRQAAVETGLGTIDLAKVPKEILYPSCRLEFMDVRGQPHPGSGVLVAESATTLQILTAAHVMLHGALSDVIIYNQYTGLMARTFGVSRFNTVVDKKNGNPLGLLVIDKDEYGQPHWLEAAMFPKLYTGKELPKGSKLFTVSYPITQKGPITAYTQLIIDKVSETEMDMYGNKLPKVYVCDGIIDGGSSGAGVYWLNPDDGKHYMVGTVEAGSSKFQKADVVLLKPYLTRLLMPIIEGYDEK